MQEIRAIQGYVHDEVVDLDFVRLDSSCDQLIMEKIPISQWDKKSPSGKFLFLTVYEYPLVAATLIFYNVSRFELVDKAETGTCIINQIFLENDKATITGCNNVDFYLYGEEISCALEISDTVLRYKKTIFPG